MRLFAFSAGAAGAAGVASAAGALALLCAVPAARPVRGGEPPLLEAAARDEHFALERDGATVGALRSIVRWSGDELYLERDLAWFAEELRLRQVERHAGASSRLYFREIRPGGRRSFSAELDRRSGACTLVEWGEREALRREIALGPDARFPLQAAEQLRRGWLGVEQVLAVLDPQSATVESWTASAVELPVIGVHGWRGWSGSSGARVLALARIDGSPVLGALAIGEGIACQTLGCGTSLARPIDAAGFEALLAQHAMAPDAPE
jgi:hypothetical protein